MLIPATALRSGQPASYYLDAQLQGPERPAAVTYAEALAAVQAALDTHAVPPPDPHTAAILRLLDDPGDPEALAVVNAALLAPPDRLSRCPDCQQWPGACRCEQPPF